MGRSGVKGLRVWGSDLGLWSKCPGCAGASIELRTTFGGMRGAFRQPCIKAGG